MSGIYVSDHEVEIYGRSYTVKVGSLIQPEEWYLGTRLKGSEWDQAEFYLPSFTYTNVETAVNIKITGHSLQRRPHHPGQYWIKVNIEFKGDGEPSAFSPGWLLAE